MRKFLLWGFVALAIVLCVNVGAGLAEAEKTFYWISHGSEGDPIWIFALKGAEKAEEDLSIKLNSSFHHNDVATHKEAFLGAIAAGADGIATSMPEIGTLNEEIALAQSQGIPVVIFNTDDPGSGRDAYVGANNIEVGRLWAQYLVDNGFVKEGDFVWMPVEVPGATYQTEETKGIASVFDPLGIKYEIFDAKYDPAESISNMTDYLTAHGDKVTAMIGLGDMVTGNTQRVFDAIGWEPGHIPVVGWGNSSETANAIKDGYVNAAIWQYPGSIGYLPIALLQMASEGLPIGYNVITLAMYDKSNVEQYLALTEQMK